MEFLDRCYRCGRSFDPDVDDNYDCARCCITGSSACCGPTRSGDLCVACYEDDFDDGEAYDDVEEGEEWDSDLDGVGE